MVRIVVVAVAGFTSLTVGIVGLLFGIATSTNGWSFAHVGLFFLPVGACFAIAGIVLIRKARSFERQKASEDSR
jgi:hypothetical protein